MKKKLKLKKWLKYILKTFTITYCAIFIISTIYINITTFKLNPLTTPLKFQVDGPTIIYNIKNNLNISFISSIIISIIIGTSIYLFKDDEKSYFKKTSLLFFTILILSGFAENIIFDNTLNVEGINIWEFPIHFIIPILLIYIAILIYKYNKQCKIVKKLNEELQKNTKRKIK